MDWQQTSLNPPIGTVFFNLIRLSPDKRDMGAVSRNIPLAEGWLAILDEHLAGRDYVNGERFTMADIPAGTSVSRWSKLPIERQSRPNVERWLARLKERPGFQGAYRLPLSAVAWAKRSVPTGFGDGRVGTLRFAHHAAPTKKGPPKRAFSFVASLPRTTLRRRRPWPSRRLPGAA